MGRSRVEGLDALRGISASVVFFYHIRGILNLPAPQWLESILIPYFGLGVPMFFMISAFTMYLVYGAEIALPGSFRRFMIKRYARLLPVYLVMFAVLFVTVRLMSAQHHIPLLQLPVYFTLMFGFLPSLATGYVWASWAVGVSMIFYLLFPAMVAGFTTWRSLALGLILSVAVSYQYQEWLSGLQEPVVPYFAVINAMLFVPAFFCGALCWALSNLKMQVPRWSLLTAAIILIGGASMLPTLPFHLLVYAFLPGFAMLLWSQVATPNRVITNRLTCFLGKISYSVYLIHSYIMYFVLKPIVPQIQNWFPNETGLVFLVVTLAGIALTVPLAILSHRNIEMPGKRWIERLSGVNPAIPR